MQFVVPQFIDIEPKIFGPITPRQFIILIITGGLIFVAYKTCDFSLFIIIGVFLFASGGTLAFLKINGRPVHYFLLNLFQTFRKPKLRIWRKEFILEKELKIKEEIEIPPVKVPRKPLPTSRLSEISLLVDTGGMYREE
ncbi:MAG: PrgI family mobile element protein [Patescibacteria group bacterium]